MPAPQNFRSAFNGFNREDVVRYLEYLNSKHTAEINQLNSDVDYLRARLETAEPQTEVITALEAERDELRAKLEALTARVAELESAPEAAPAAPVVAPAATANAELEAYRRAERAERVARERAELVYHQVNGVLAEASLKVESVASEIGGMADSVMSQLTQLQVAVANSKKALNEAASTMYAIRPNE